MSARRCDGSGVRVPLTVGEERRRETYCHRCDRAVKVRPAREDGNPMATIPQHNTLALHPTSILTPKRTR